MEGRGTMIVRKITSIGENAVAMQFTKSVKTEDIERNENTGSNNLKDPVQI